MSERHHDAYVDVSKTLKSQTMSEVDYDWVEDNADLISNIKQIKKKKTSKLNTGKSGFYIDPKTGKKFPTSKNTEELFRQMEMVINSTTWLIEYAKHLEITDLEFEDMVSVVKTYDELNEEFFELTNITIDIWEEIYYNAIKVKGKNKLHHLYNMERQCQ
jgi:transposase